MKRYLLSIYQPDGAPPPAVDLEKIMADVAAVNVEMQKAGVWVFSDGLHQPETSTVLRHKDGEITMTDGPYMEGKEHLGGLSIIQVPDLDAALYWAKKLTKAIDKLPIEVRPFQSHGKD